MCELLGLAFNEPVTVRISFRAFRHRGRHNPHGWGLAWFHEGRPEIQKEEYPPAHRSEKARNLLNCPIVSHIFIGHVRLASRGDRRPENTHPFCKDFHGTPVVFAHNGTLKNLPEPSHFHPDGETDSEQAFCLLLSWMQEEQIAFSDFPKIEDWLRQLNNKGTMNLLFSNGTELFAYRDAKEHNGLCFTYRKAPFPVVTLEDEEWCIDLSEVKKPSERGFVIATRPLTNEDWTALRPGSLLVIREGKAVYGDPRA